MSKPSLVILVSGSGSNLQAIIDAVDNLQLNATITAVISNRPGVKGIERASSHNIPTHIIDHTTFSDRHSFDQSLIQCIDKHQPTLVILAGFMRILTDDFIQHYHNRLLNIHPSLLPKYKGLDTHQRALNSGDKKHGASVHLVSTELDSGSIVLQAEVDIQDNDSSKTLAQRVLAQEHIIYPLAISLLTEGKLTFDADRLLYNGCELNRPLIWRNGEILTLP